MKVAISGVLFFVLSCDGSSDDQTDVTLDTASATDTKSNDSETSVDTGNTDQAEAGNDAVALSILVPASFDGVPVMIGVNYFDNADLTGIPTGFGEKINHPEIVPGEPFPIESPQPNLTGVYYVAVVLYCEGGGNGMTPVADVDWRGRYDQPVTIGPGTGRIDLGEIQMITAQ